MINILYWTILIVVLLVVTLKCRKKLEVKRGQIQKKEYIIIALIFGLLCIIPIFVDGLQDKNCVSYSNKVVAGNSEEDYEKVGDVGEIKGDIEIEQTFYCEGSAIEYIRLYTTNYDRTNNGTIKVELWDKDEDVLIDEWEVDMSEIPDYKYIQLDVTNPFIIDSAAHICAIIVSSEDASKGNAISLLKVPDHYKGGSLFISGKEKDADIMFNVMGYGLPENKEYARIALFIMLLCFVEGYIYIRLWRNRC